MFTRDKLTKKERLRLECVAQAIALGGGHILPETVVIRALRFENYIKEGH